MVNKTQVSSRRTETRFKEGEQSRSASFSPGLSASCRRFSERARTCTKLSLCLAERCR